MNNRKEVRIMNKTYKYQWDDREKAWVVINNYGQHVAVFFNESHAMIWTKMRNGQAYIVDKEPPTILGDSE